MFPKVACLLALRPKSELATGGSVFEMVHIVARSRRGPLARFLEIGEGRDGASETPAGSSLPGHDLAHRALARSPCSGCSQRKATRSHRVSVTGSILPGVPRSRKRKFA